MNYDDSTDTTVDPEMTERERQAYPAIKYTPGHISTNDPLYGRRPSHWADVPEKEKWKYTIGVGIRLFAINAGLGVLFFLILLVAI